MGTLAPRVSAALRAAEIPVLRYSDRKGDRGRFGIRVGNEGVVGGRNCRVSIPSDADDAMGWSDKAMAVLIARGFEVTRFDGQVSLTVREGSASAQPEDVHAVVAASDLDIFQPMQNCWLVRAEGSMRTEYEIRRTGKDAKTRFAVTKAGTTVAKNLRSMAEALAAVEKDRDGDDD
ncbi:hypothetical protein ACFRAQ_34835 [Nocardia sp. NPDC056611]|uniref:hypothetical protein n=1 Tax=Nocardia sp. NPDC056611 TaxID=3345877 RepID=UPI0036718A4D